MQFLFDIINKPLAWVLQNLASVFSGNFAAAVFVFTLLINLALIPLSVKSQKSSVQQTRIKPKLDDLKKRCGDDRQKYSEGMQKLYQEEGVSMSGGCLPIILRLVLMMSIYWLIMSPLTYMSGADKDKISNVNTVITASMKELKNENEDKYLEYKERLNFDIEKSARNELGVVNIVRDETGILEEILSKKEYNKIKDDLADIKAKDRDSNINYSLFTDKLNLTESPKWSWNIFNDAQLIWILPFMAFISQMLSSILSMRMQKKINPEAPNMTGMMLTMPLISLFIGFGFPGGVTFYWTCSSLIGGFIQLGVQNFYGPHKMLSRERAKELVKRCEFEAEKINKTNLTENEEN